MGENWGRLKIVPSVADMRSLTRVQARVRGRRARRKLAAESTPEQQNPVELLDKVLRQLDSQRRRIDTVHAQLELQQERNEETDRKLDQVIKLLTTTPAKPATVRGSSNDTVLHNLAADC